MGYADGIERFALGDWGTNCYLLHGDDTDTVLIDAGFAPDAVLDRLETLKLQLTDVVLTHTHVDHIAGLPTVRARFPDVRVHVHADEAAFLGDPVANLSAWLAEPVTVAPAEATLTPGNAIELAGRDWQIRHTPGHSPGGISLVQPDLGVAIVGDTLFANGVGRTDFPTSDPPRLIRSIREQLLTLPDDTRVLPGHGPETTIGRERATNPWLQDR
jgi:glyoxylase-like metal-dependent hydrolase (beta-lactamase superfamily II)